MTSESWFDPVLPGAQGRHPQRLPAHLRAADHPCPPKSWPEIPGPDSGGLPAALVRPRSHSWRSRRTAALRAAVRVACCARWRRRRPADRFLRLHTRHAVSEVVAPVTSGSLTSFSTPRPANLRLLYRSSTKLTNKGNRHR
uniref:Putative secreted protein n=1 Tax=Ixodes ricinus TaxID=34613 RepID=A0A0K8RJG2_IXORI